MNIPKSFQIMGHNIKINLNPSFRLVEGNLGVADYQTCTITLQKDTPEFPISRTALEHTYCHEMVHWILYSMGEEELRENEKFVDLFGGFLHQILNTSKGDQ